MKKPRFKQNINVTIQNLGINGEGVGYWHGYTIFADGTLPGEAIRGRLIQRERNFGRIQPVSIQNPNPDRVTPPCPLFNRCGGCQLMHLSYEQQLDLKRQLVIKAFERLAGMPDIKIETCLPSPAPLQYRNKIQLPVVASEDGIQIGLYARHSHDLVPVDHCLVHCELGEKAFQTISKSIKESSVVPYDFKTGLGELRYLMVKTAIHTKQVLVTFVTATEASPALKELAKTILRRCPEVKGVVQNINSTPDNVILSNSYKLLEGEPHIEELLCGLLFKISPASFFQVNTLQAERLYTKALEFAQLTGQEVALDAYCGVGTLSLLIAKKTKYVFAVESTPEAIDDAKINATRNAINNIVFTCNDAREYIMGLQPIDVAFVNPPRKGCELSFLEKLAQLAPKRLVYISCDPGTLARDSAILCEKGYCIEQIQPFDMFPQTMHVECVAAFIKTN